MVLCHSSTKVTKTLTYTKYLWTIQTIFILWICLKTHLSLQISLFVFTISENCTKIIYLQLFLYSVNIKSHPLLNLSCLGSDSIAKAVLIISFFEYSNNFVFLKTAFSYLGFCCIPWIIRFLIQKFLTRNQQGYINVFLYYMALDYGNVIDTGKY